MKISKFSGKIDESYFCLTLSRMDLKEYRSTANKILVFGMLKIYSKIYNCFANLVSLITLLFIQIIRKLIVAWLIIE